MKQKTNKLVAGGLIVLAGVTGLGAGFLLDNPETKVEVVKVNVKEKVPVIVEKEVIKTVEVPVEKIVTQTVTETVEVEDTEMLKLLCDREMYDDIIDCKVEVQAEDEALKLAIAEIKKNFADELEDEDLVDDEDDVELVTVYDDYEDIEIVKSDYDDDEYRFKITAKVDDNEADKKFKVEFDIEVEDGEAKIRDVSTI